MKDAEIFPGRTKSRGIFGVAKKELTKGFFGYVEKSCDFFG